MTAATHRYWCLEHGHGPHPVVPATEANLAKECAAKGPVYGQPGGAFLPESYRKLRHEGYPPCAIDYDMCHVFR